MILTYIAHSEIVVYAPIPPIRYVLAVQYMLRRSIWKWTYSLSKSTRKDWPVNNKLSTSWIRGSFIAINLWSLDRVMETYQNTYIETALPSPLVNPNWIRMRSYASIALITSWCVCNASKVQMGRTTSTAIQDPQPLWDRPSELSVTKPQSVCLSRFN